MMRKSLLSAVKDRLPSSSETSSLELSLGITSSPYVPFSFVPIRC